MNGVMWSGVVLIWLLTLHSAYRAWQMYRERCHIKAATKAVADIMAEMASQPPPLPPAPPRGYTTKRLLLNDRQVSILLSRQCLREHGVHCLHPEQPIHNSFSIFHGSSGLQLRIEVSYDPLYAQ